MSVQLTPTPLMDDTDNSNILPDDGHTITGTCLEMGKCAYKLTTWNIN
jgi:hypothetical protein